MWNSATPTRGLLAGLIAFSIFLVFISWGEPSAFREGAVALFIITAVCGIVGYQLLSAPVGAGYGVSLLTGVLAASFIVFLGSGAVKPDYPNSAVIENGLPLIYSLLGVVLIIVSIIPPIRGSTETNLSASRHTGSK